MTAAARTRRASHARPGFESGLVSVLRNGSPVGAGMLVDRRHVVTCTHVWEEACDRGGTPAVGFCHAQGRQRAVELVASRPVAERHGDVAVLRVKGRLPLEAQPVHLVEAPELSGHRFEVWGFPRPEAGEQLAHGVLTRRRGDGLVQLEGDTVTGLAVAPGFSGAPIWDLNLEAVVGIVTSVDPDADTRTGYLIPVDVLAETWPKLRRERPHVSAGTPRQVVGVRPTGEHRQWYDRETVRGELVERIRRGRPITQVVGRRGVGKSGVVTRVVTCEQDAGGLLDGVVFLSTRTQAQEVTLERIVRSLAALLPPAEEQRLLTRWGGVREAVLPDLFTSLRGRTVVVLDNLDDVQDPSTGELQRPDLVTFLQAVVATPDPPLVITTSQRPLGVPPDLRPELVPPVRMTDGLPPAEAAAMLRELDEHGAAGLFGADETLLRDLAGRVDGLPRGLQLLVNFLLDHEMSGLKRLTRTHRAPAEVLDALVSVAYEQLSGPAREVVEVIAVAGAPLSCADLPHLVPDASPEDVEDAVDDLLRRQELVRGGDEDIVRLHPLDTDHVRNRLPEERRRDLHLRLAERYRRTARPPEQLRLVGDADPLVHRYRHLWAAGKHGEALDQLAAVAEFLSRRGAHAVLREAVALAETADRTGTLAYHVCRGFLELTTGSKDAAQREFGEAAALDPSSATWPTWRGVALRHMGRPERAVDVLGPLVRDPATPRQVRQFAGLEHGLSLCYLGRVDEARATADLVRHLTLPGDPPEVRAYVADIEALSQIVGGRFHEALRLADAGMRDYAQDAVTDGVEYVRNVRGVALLGLGRTEEAAAEFRTCREAGHGLGQDRLEGIAGVNLAWALLLLHRRDEVAPVARAAAERLHASATEGADGALAIAAAAEGTEPATALRRARDVLRTNPDFHRPSDEELERLAAGCGRTGPQPMDGGRSASGTTAVSPVPVFADGTPLNRYGTAPMPGWTM